MCVYYIQVSALHHFTLCTMCSLETIVLIRHSGHWNPYLVRELCHRSRSYQLFAGYWSICLPCWNCIISYLCSHPILLAPTLVVRQDLCAEVRCNGTEELWTIGPGFCCFLEWRPLVDISVAIEFVPSLGKERFKWFYDFWIKVIITGPDSLRMKRINVR